MNDVSLLRSPLDDRHRGLGAKMSNFGGWEMPIEYGASGGGVLVEHAAVREGVGAFDVSHLGKVSVEGPGAAEFLNRILTNDLARIGPGKAQYSLMCDEKSGGVVDDLILYFYDDDHILLVPNAANAGEVVRRLQSAAPGTVSIRNRHADFGMLAVQGPQSSELLRRLGTSADLEYMSFHNLGQSVVCRTGYTGEHGYEVIPQRTDMVSLWDQIMRTGDDLNIRPCGLAARDTLRTEMGYPLHGQDLSIDITPVQARISWAVGWNKPAFWGRGVLTRERDAGPARQLWGIEAIDRNIPRPAMTVLVDDHEAGVVTSGTFSPTLRKGIGLALLDTSYELEAGQDVTVDVRGRHVGMRLVRPPFVRSRVREDPVSLGSANQAV